MDEGGIASGSARGRRMTLGRFLRVLGPLLACLAFTAPAAIAATCPRTSVADLEDEVMCPVCGTPLALATEAPQAQRQRAFILKLVERCRSKDQIKAALVTEFGPGVLATPSREGFGLAAYLVPVLVLAAAAGGLGMAALRWRGGRAATARSGAGSDPPPEPDREAAARLDADLGRFGD